MIINVLFMQKFISQDLFVQNKTEEANGDLSFTFERNRLKRRTEKNPIAFKGFILRKKDKYTKAITVLYLRAETR